MEKIPDLDTKLRSEIGSVLDGVNINCSIDKLFMVVC